jgi:hypothetical protein
VLVRDSDGREVENKGKYLGLNSKLQDAADLTEFRKLHQILNNMHFGLDAKIVLAFEGLLI